MYFFCNFLCKYFFSVVTFTEEILNEKLHFVCSVTSKTRLNTLNIVITSELLSLRIYFIRFNNCRREKYFRKNDMIFLSLVLWQLLGLWIVPQKQYRDCGFKILCRFLLPSGFFWNFFNFKNYLWKRRFLLCIFTIKSSESATGVL